MTTPVSTTPQTQSVGVKETSEFLFFIALIVGILAKHAKAKSSFIFIAKDLIAIIFQAQTAIEGFNQIGFEVTDLSPEERVELEYAVKQGISTSMPSNSKVEVVAASTTTASIAIYQAVRTLKG